MKPCILYRPSDGLDATEEDAAKLRFPVYRHRTDIPRDSLVVGRYSVLPFYADLEYDLCKQGATLVNTHREHEFVADVLEWAPLLGDMTPPTWDRLQDLPEHTTFVVKGQTNSRKDRWDTHMYAPSKRDAVEVTLKLQEDSLIQTQRIYYREYWPLRQFMTGLHGQPVTEEYRFFVYDDEILTGAYYWSSYVEDVKAKLGRVPTPSPEIHAYVGRALGLLSDSMRPRFLVIDVGVQDNGEPMVVELNDGQMSGLSENDPLALYTALKEAMHRCPYCGEDAEIQMSDLDDSHGRAFHTNCHGTVHGVLSGYEDG